tara:strand:- start:1023 stop:1184 length:162 start_codon:yes stop_codon:yes gene_type:complete
MIDINKIKPCECGDFLAYKPQNISAPMMQIGWCVWCGMPETQEQLDKSKIKAK